MLTILVCWAIAFAGCSHHSGGSLDQRIRASVLSQARDARSRGFPEQARALSDGILTDAEYASLFSLYRECMAKGGVLITHPVRSPIDGRTLLYDEEASGRPTASQNESSFQCLARYIGMTAATIAEAPGNMAEPLRAFVRRCLSPKDVPTSIDSKNLRQMSTLAGHDNLPVLNQCVLDGMQAKYPDLPMVTFAPPTLY